MVAYLSGKLGRATEEARAAAEVELRAKRRIGELLPPPEQGGRGKLAEARRVSPDLDLRRASEFRKLAEVPAEAFEGYIEEQREAEKPPSTSEETKLSQATTALASACRGAQRESVAGDD